MNPLTNVKNITKLNQIELERGTVDKKSWHDIYKESAWIFIGGLSYGLTEGDILSVFSQYGEIVNINLVRDKKTGKTKGFCFICYANQKSTVLAVDNFNGIKICGRTIRVDHVANYKPPKENENEDDITKQLKAEGCAPRPIKMENTSEEAPVKKKSKKVKKEKKKHKKHKKNDFKQEGSVKVKQEKYDPGYAKYEVAGNVKPKQKVQRSESEDSESSSDESSSDYSSRVTNRESAQSVGARKDSKTHSKFENKPKEPNRSKTNAKDAYGTNDFKRRHDDSSSEESTKRKKSHKTSKSKKSETSMRSISEARQDSSDESERYSTSTQGKNKDNKIYGRSISPFKDKHSVRHSHYHKRHDSFSSESDSAHKQDIRESDKNRSKHQENSVRKDYYSKNNKDYHQSSSSNYYDSDEKYKKSKRSYENGSSSTSNSHKPYENKNHRHMSRSSRTERNDR